MRSAIGIAITLTLVACSDGSTPPLSVIVLTAENQWIHPSNPVAAEALEVTGAERGWTVQVTADPRTFDSATLAQTDVVVFSVTSGPILDDAARAELETFWTGGGGYVGVHSASSTEGSWPFYRELLPVTFLTHPTVQEGPLTVESSHPIVSGVPDPWLHTDEFYTFNERPEELDVDLLLALDESAAGPDYPDNVRVGYHPLAFSHEKLGGRVFYTALGHTPESYSEPVFMQMLAQGIEWAGAERHARR